VTARCTKAIEQLGSGRLDVRIGGIYALERTAHDSPRDHLAVLEVLARVHPRATLTGNGHRKSPARRRQGGQRAPVYRLRSS
jgi:hypothetical protein